jgi:hypothetical protein
VAAHPAARAFDVQPEVEVRPGFAFRYLNRAPLPIDESTNYMIEGPSIANGRPIQFMLPLAGIVGALHAAGGRLDRLEEHKGVTWRLFPRLAPRVGELVASPAKA